MNYSEKLKSPKWQRKRLEVLNRDNFKCCSCGDEETELHVHHLKYNGEPYDAPVEDLQTLCKHCHWYFTFNNVKLFNDFDLKYDRVIRTEKLDNCFISVLKYNFVIYCIYDDGLDFVALFSKKSSILDKILEISNSD